jgi:hypothetical protein
MNLYRLKNLEALPETDPDYDPRIDASSYHGTLGEAQAAARDRFEPHMRSTARIELVDADVSKDGVLHILATGAPRPLGIADVLRSWSVSARGGLRELEGAPCNT